MHRIQHGQHPAAQPEDAYGPVQEIAAPGVVSDDAGHQEEKNRVQHREEEKWLVNHHSLQKQPGADDEGEDQQDGEEAQVEGGPGFC